MGEGVVEGSNANPTGEPVLSVRDLVVEYKTGQGVNDPAHRAVDGVSFDLYPGESIALIGESGCGKTTLGLGLLRLLPKLGSIPSGSVTYRRRDGSTVDLLKLDKQQLRKFRWSEAAMVFQGAMNSFNPVLKVWDQMYDTVRAHDRSMSKRTAYERATQVLRDVDLDPDRVLKSYPHELSGGMRQRVLIAMAMLLRPQMLILDEPTTALDILTQRAIVDLIHELHERLDFAMIFVSHDLAVAAELATRVATMYGGKIVEMGDVRDIFYRPQHDYTKSLINAVPTVTEERKEVPTHG
ncbi:ABC transporter ATP-binding protein [Actinopolymorpha singaporensis]|uniref:Peptide/nickel transport system ATP-binding protein n=1 Tax=Actinopolymorpha singaporensis TaxID=117157 RepID=A0A1H1V9W8_9ACTN|nr:ABC transporter ATP-binding protein [Actinopolymorpha singaporensis]SDS81196.1 peptide/nickel transport system ATP-binding protein [Actinopolymorpha singaporensis]